MSAKVKCEGQSGMNPGVVDGESEGKNSCLEQEA